MTGLSGATWMHWPSILETPLHLLLGTQDAQLFSSTDSGNSWHRVKPGIKALDYTLTVILFDRERRESSS
jgi:hypothetical protein